MEALLNRMPLAEEVFLIVRELSHGKLLPGAGYTLDGHFRWKTWYNACVAVMRPSKYQAQACFKSTVGNMLRAQVKAGTILRTQRGHYIFMDRPTSWGNWRKARPAHPLYVVPDRFNMTPGETGGRRA